MSHEIDTSNGRMNMAHVKGSAKPWWGLGHEVPADASIAEWQVAGGLNFKVVKGELMFKDADGTIHEAGTQLNRAVLYRDDTFAPLSVMSVSKYKIHQPEDILGFVADVSKAMGWPVETVGSLFGGRKIWALLKLPEAFTLAGGDKVEGYLLASTSFDGSTGSEFKFVTVRVVCNNTLQMALGTSKIGAVVYHSADIDIAKVKEDLGIGANVWSNFIETAKKLAAITISKAQATSMLRKVYGEPKEVVDEKTKASVFVENPNVVRTLGYFEGQGIGAKLASSRGTGWGLVNAVTQEVDHFGSNRSARLNSAWFGPGADRKAAIVDAVLESVAA